MPRLTVIAASTRPGRAGLPIAKWFLERARAHAKFEIDFADLKEIGLPFLDEPKHPRLGQYEHAHTKAWSARVKAADAFVMVTPEYNNGTAPALLNALDFLYNEWNYKPAGFVSYGGISGGTRSVQAAKLTLATLKMVPIVEAVNIPFFTNQLQGEGDARVFNGTEAMEKSATAMLDELLRWSNALTPMRA